LIPEAADDHHRGTRPPTRREVLRRRPRYRRNAGAVSARCRAPGCGTYSPKSLGATTVGMARATVARSPRHPEDVARIRRRSAKAAAAKHKEAEAEEGKSRLSSGRSSGMPQRSARPRSRLPRLGGAVNRRPSRGSSARAPRRSRPPPRGRPHGACRRGASAGRASRRQGEASGASRSGRRTTVDGK
jgi:hypothetical protein